MRNEPSRPDRFRRIAGSPVPVVLDPKALPVEDVTHADIEKFMAGMRTKGVPITGNRCLALLSKAFNLAIRWGWRETNPAKGAARHRERARSRYLTTDEYKRLAAALAALEANHPGPVAARRGGQPHIPTTALCRATSAKVSKASG